MDESLDYANASGALAGPQRPHGGQFDVRLTLETLRSGRQKRPTRTWTQHLRFRLSACRRRSRPSAMTSVCSAHPFVVEPATPASGR